MTSSNPGRGAFPGLEGLRVVAMLEIVTFHVMHSSARLPVVAGLGLPIFLLLGSALAVVSAERHGAWHVIRSKSLHLGRAWLFWCAVYGVLRVLLAVRSGSAVLFSKRMLLGGTWIHLWFVPFSIASAVVVATTCTLTRRWPVWSKVVLFVLLGGALAALSLRFGELPWPVHQWNFSMPAIPWGIALGYVLSSGGAQRWKIAGLAAAVDLVVFLPSLGLPGHTSLWRFSVSFLLILAFILLPWRNQATAGPLRYLGPRMLGVYFVHCILIFLVPSHAHPVLAVAGVFVGAILVVEVVARTPLRWTVLPGKAA